VSRALRDDPRISPETRTKVKAIARQISYPQAARSDAPTPRRRTVGVVVSDVTNPFYPELLDVIQTELGFLGLQALLFNQRTSTIMTPTLMKQVEQHSVDGLILTSVSSTWLLPEPLTSGRIPTVLLNRLVDDARIDAVTADNVEGGRLAAEYLTGLGHRRLAVVSGPQDISTHRDRRSGFEDFVSALPERTLFDTQVPASGYSHASGFQATHRLLRENPDVTAVFCTNDLMAYGALSAARELGVSVPGRLSVLGFDDIEMSAWPALALSTIHHPFRDMAKLASQRLADLMDNPDPGPPRHVRLPVRIVARSTTSRPEEDRS
jgi:LacI family transcriptional regulator